MNFFKRLLGKTPAPSSVDEFWKWFLPNASAFYETIKKKEGVLIHSRFLDKIVPRLQALNPEFYCETGMIDDVTAELVISAEGDIKSFVFVEDLIAAAPALPNWKFTALKPSTGTGMSIEMNGTSFDNENIRFFYEDESGYPDEINLVMVHPDYSEDNRKTITQGCLLYLDALLGELNAATLIDNVVVKAPDPATDLPLIPMDKLNEFLNWKEKEFVEKYEGTRHDTASDEYAALEGEDEEGLPSIAVVNTHLLNWDAKASHPWMAVITVDYSKQKETGDNGMPGESQFEALNHLQDDLDRQLTDVAGYLHLGRETYKGESNIYYACREFRQVSKVIDQAIRADWKDGLVCSYEIYKDKYWRTMDKFMGAF
ncbi:MAG TPA: DUF695 domain-containing protein [Puia sp.]|uniref:DUF695 domain-containing protein n=1 Tax=Puia sp. TaxID=2045100 RepID=UPI002D159920|nr:DUF695 domain-containing protein [Puia sp.]HVU95595.1 DUF695 domain-containing protein [Puia sp.]